MSGLVKGVGKVFEHPEPPDLLAPFDDLTEWALGLAQWTLEPNREPWMNYMASIGIAGVRTCVSIRSLVIIDSIEGVPILARELYQLASRFVDCIDRRHLAMLAGLQKEINQLRKIRNLQQGKGIHEEDVSPYLDDRERAFEKLNPDRLTVSAEPESGTNLELGDRERYQLLCLGAHNRPGALFSKYDHHLYVDQLTPFQSEPREQVNKYLIFAARAVYVMCERYFQSALFPEPSRQENLDTLQGLYRPFTVT